MTIKKVSKDQLLCLIHIKEHPPPPPPFPSIPASFPHYALGPVTRSDSQTCSMGPYRLPHVFLTCSNPLTCCNILRGLTSGPQDQSSGRSTRPQPIPSN